MLSQFDCQNSHTFSWFVPEIQQNVSACVSEGTLYLLSPSPRFCEYLKTGCGTGFSYCGSQDSHHLYVFGANPKPMPQKLPVPLYRAHLQTLESINHAKAMSRRIQSRINCLSLHVKISDEYYTLLCNVTDSSAYLLSNQQACGLSLLADAWPDADWTGWNKETCDGMFSNRSDLASIRDCFVRRLQIPSDLFEATLYKCLYSLTSTTMEHLALNILTQPEILQQIYPTEFNDGGLKFDTWETDNDAFGSEYLPFKVEWVAEQEPAQAVTYWTLERSSLHTAYINGYAILMGSSGKLWWQRRLWIGSKCDEDCLVVTSDWVPSQALDCDLILQNYQGGPVPVRPNGTIVVQGDNHITASDCAACLDTSGTLTIRGTGTLTLDAGVHCACIGSGARSQSMKRWVEDDHAPRLTHIEIVGAIVEFRTATPNFEVGRYGLEDPVTLTCKESGKAIGFTQDPHKPRMEYPGDTYAGSTKKTGEARYLPAEATAGTERTQLFGGRE